MSGANHGNCGGKQVFFLEAEDLVLITDPSDPCWDSRVDLPIREADILNVGTHGIIEPVVARRRGDRVIVIDGRQRVKWCRALNARLQAQGSELVRVPVVLRSPEDDAEFLEVAISANEIRSDDGILDKARKAARLTKLGRSIGDIARTFGVGMSAVQTWLRAGELSDPVKKAITEQRVTMSDALWKVGPLPPEKQEEALAELERTKPSQRARVRSGKPGRTPAQGPGPNAAATNSTAHRLRHLVRFVATNPEALPEGFRVVLLWLLREATDSELVAVFPSLTPLVADRTSAASRNERRDTLRERHRALQKPNGTGGEGLPF